MNWSRVQSGLVSTLCLVLLPSCVSERDTRRTNLEQHARSFRDNLDADLVEAATRDNRKIEAIAASLSLAMGKRTEQSPLPDYEHDRDLYDSATIIAVENWLALARHYAATGRYAEAQTTYQRILDHYTAPRYRTPRAEAEEGLRDLEVLQARPPGHGAVDETPPR